ncbi:MAG: hypothetical protein PHO91_01420 [Patescibacteria group bacterium]|nr:hypothetical protein [Patescibacteria group bacterium]
MSKKQVIGSLPSKVLGLLADLMHKLQHGVITVRELELFLQRQNPFAISDIQSEWQEFYRKYFRLSVSFSDASIPDNAGGFDRVIFIPKGLKLNDVLKAMKKCFPVSSYIDDLDKDVIDNVRVSDCNYAIRIRERVEADEELKNLSANKLRQQGVNAMTLLERLVYELKYFSETNEHLDVQNWTLCAGSRGRDGGVPCVFWLAGNGRLRVGWFFPGFAVGFLRARQSVS